MSLDPFSEGVRRLERMALELAQARTSVLLLRLQLTAREMRSLRKELEVRYGYNPEEPRIPRGRPGAGQWTREGDLGGVQVAETDKDPDEAAAGKDPISELDPPRHPLGDKPNPATNLELFPGGAPLLSAPSAAAPSLAAPGIGTARGLLPTAKPNLEPEPAGGRSPGDEGNTSGAASSEPTVSPGTPTDQHHPIPMYLGGAVAQSLVTLARTLHQTYHGFLDGVLPRRAGTAYYRSLTPEEKDSALELLAERTKEFDQKYGTSLYDSLFRNLSGGDQ